MSEVCPSCGRDRTRIINIDGELYGQCKACGEVFYLSDKWPKDANSSEVQDK
jgi:uncharacterized Zn finger protein